MYVRKIYCKCVKIGWAKHSRFQPVKFFMGMLCGAWASSIYYLTIPKYSQKNFRGSNSRTAKVQPSKSFPVYGITAKKVL